MRRALAPVMLLLLTAQPAVAQNFVEGTHFWLEPATFPGTAAPKDHPRGPGKAKGVVLWNDGYSGDQVAPDKVPPIVQYFAEQGWDAFNLRRHSLFYTQRVSPLLLHGIDRIVERGYKRILLMGQSAGAYASIEIGLSRPEVVGILPLAPAGFGDYGRGQQWRQNDFTIRQMWDYYKGASTRVAAAFFSGDDWYETQVPHVRGPYAKQRLTELGVANFIVSQPEYAGMTTHFGGVRWEFARRFGPCLEYFFETGTTPSCDDADPATAAIFRINLPPAPAADQSGFAGLWQGTWKSGQFAVVAIEAKPDGKFEASYRLGLGLNGGKPETTTMPLVQRGGMLVRDNNIEFRFSLEEDGRLKLVRVDRAKASAPGEENYAYLKRVAQPTLTARN